MKRVGFAAAMAALLLAPVAPAAAQDAAVHPTGAFEVWGGYAHGSPAAGLLGDTPGMNFGIIALRWSRGVGKPRTASEDPPYEVSFDLVPVARISKPLESVLPCVGATACVRPAGPNGDEGYFPDESPYGIGLNAFGLTRRFVQSPRLSFTLGTTAGALFFEERVPTTRGSAMNFMLGVEAGARFGGRGSPAIVIAYRGVHLSNAGMQHENPGVLAHLITIGLSRPR